jgi:hypothetical protein
MSQKKEIVGWIDPDTHVSPSCFYADAGVLHNDALLLVEIGPQTITLPLTVTNQVSVRIDWPMPV